jgi:hypothetical protein
MKAKKCPLCNGEPQFVYYAIPDSTNDPDGIYVLFKRLECTECGATVANLVMTCDDAVNYWNEINPNTNRRYVLEKVGTEPCEAEGADNG